MEVSEKRTEAEQCLLGTGGVMSAEVVPFNYLHFKKDDGGTTEKSTDNDKRIGKRLILKTVIHLACQWSNSTLWKNEQGGKELSEDFSVYPT